MQFTLEQQTYLAAYSVRCALTMPITWDCADSYLSKAEMDKTLNKWLESRDESIREIARDKISREKAYYYKLIESQQKALRFARERDLVRSEFEPQFQSSGKGIILWSVDQGDDTIAAAEAIAREYDLLKPEIPYNSIKDSSITGARYMADLQARRQIGDFSLDLVGDDRGWGEGAYYLYLKYNNQEVDRLFKLNGCGLI